LASSPTPERAFERLVREQQAEARLPSLSAAAFSGGEIVWQRALGLADAERGEEATPEHQYGIASITKMFVAASILQLRDEGRLDLEDQLSRHLSDVEHGTLTIRGMLAHVSGLQREPPGEIWETLRAPTREELLAGLGEAEQVLPPNVEWHYSNLAYSLLGEVIERVSGIPFGDYVEQRLLGPLGLDGTAWKPTRPAKPYYVEPYSDAVSEEPGLELGGTGAAGGLWSTAGDLARWAGFLADPDPAILSPASAAQMRSVQAIIDDTWTSGHGLGLQLWRRGERVFAGHTGGLPGFVSIVAWTPKEQAGAAILTGGGSWPGLIDTGLKLAGLAADELPVPKAEWRPGSDPPEEIAPLLGRWWSEGSEFVFSWRDGALQARPADLPTVLPPAIFERESDDTWRTASGRERGELLRVVRDPDGGVTKLYWATYPFTRDAQSFGAGVPAPVEETG
jgi:CubicO group peptidase (beta-lactamase class C family)